MKKIIIPNNITPELAEETGWHIGDGSMNFYFNNRDYAGSYSLRGYIRDDREHYETRVKKIFKSVYGVEVNCHEMPSMGMFGFQIWSDEIVKFKNKILGLPLGKKKSVKIPRKILKNQKLVISVIRGIFDTDGNLYLEHKNNLLYPRIKITTISKILANQIRKYLDRLGFRSTCYNLKRPQKNWNDIYIVNVRGVKETKKWFDIIEPKNPKFLKRYKILLDQQLIL